MADSERENFLDRGAILALIIAGAAWFLWDSHMRRKYPKKPPQTPALSSANLKEAEPAKSQQPAAPSFSQKALAAARQTEEIFRLSSKEASFEVSSLGMGLKSAHLKGFADRKGEEIVFRPAPGEPPLFALIADSAPVPFKVRRLGEKALEGRFSHKGAEIVKTLSVEDSGALKAKAVLKGHEEGAFAVRFQVQKKAEAEKAGRLSAWYSKLLFLPIADQTGAYVSAQDRTERLLDGQGQASLQNAFVLGLGTKYFGMAFVNQSPLLPSAHVRPLGHGFQAEAVYSPPPGKPIALEYTLFAGPKSWESLSRLGNETAAWVDFGFFSWLAWPLLKTLKFFHKVLGNWGLAIIALTFLIRLLLLPLNMKSYKSMQIMQAIQPEIKALREKYKKDNKKLNEEVMALMRKRKANPAGGCLTGFLQLPLFFALYRVLSESVELYQAPFAFWIKDLSFRDPFYALPVLCSVAIFLQQKSAPPSASPAQARMMAILPWVFSVFLLGLPSGLTLYIFVSSAFGAIQQYFFVRRKNSSSKDKD